MHIQSDFFPACVYNASPSSKVYVLVDIAPLTPRHISNRKLFEVNLKNNGPRNEKWVPRNHTPKKFCD